MSVADQTKSLTEDIEVSYETRVAALSDIVNETHQTLGQFHRERAEMARNLWHSLAENRRERTEMARNLKRSRVASRSELTNQVQKIKVENTKHFQEKAQETAAFLARSKEERRAEFTTLLGEIKEVVAAIEKEADETIADFSSEQKEMADHLRKNLRQTVDSLITDFSVDRQQSRSQWAHLSTNTRATKAKTASQGETFDHI